MLVDSLCHLEDPRIENVRALLERAAKVGVTDVVSVGTDPRYDPRAIPGAADPRVRVWRAFGIHPRAAREDLLEEQLRALEEKLSLPGVVALGECGLDGRPEMPSLDVQERALQAQLSLARERRLPVVLHHVKATERFLRALEVGGPFAGGGMLHGYTGAPDPLSRLFALNLSVSFGGLVSRPRSLRAHASAKAAPLARLLIESDAPDHPPAGTPDGIAEPAHLPVTLRALAALREEPYEVLMEATSLNARRLFRLPAPERGAPAHLA